MRGVKSVILRMALYIRKSPGNPPGALMMVRINLGQSALIRCENSQREHGEYDRGTIPIFEKEAGADGLGASAPARRSSLRG